MNFYYTILFLLALISFVAIMYKVKLRSKIFGLKGMVHFIFRIPTIFDLLPMRVKNEPENEIEMRKRANLALITFYISFLTALIIITIAGHYCKTC
jgi:hypothetical protein